MIVFTRLGGLITTAPLISTYPIPMQIKTWFYCYITFIMFPLVLAKAGFPIPTSIPALTMILLKEFVIGYIVGFVANVIFISVEIAADWFLCKWGLQPHRL